MSNSYTLDDLRNDLEREFAPVTIDLGSKTVTLKNLMRLSREDRATVVAELEVVQETETNSGEGIDAVLTSIKLILSTVAGPSDGKALSAAIGDDLALGMKIMRLWSEATQVGEAEHSPS